MRDIKFRGKPLSKDLDWQYGDLLHTEHLKDEVLIGGVKRDGFGKIFQSGILVKPETVGQYTGLKDKNGVEIYEGDIVSRYYHSYTSHYSAITLGYEDSEDHFMGNVIGEVVYVPSKGYVLKPIRFDSDLNDDEVPSMKGYVSIVQYKSIVIGNIHDTL